MRITTPFFQLYTAALSGSQVTTDQKTLDKLTELLKELQFRMPENTSPVGLRWNMHPQFGFPRQPFKVWRRLQDYSNVAIQIKSNIKDTINGSLNYQWPNGELYIVAVTAVVNAGQGLTVYPLDRNFQRIPGKEKQLTATGTVTIKTPFINAIEVDGTGTVTGVQGVSQSTYVGLADWQQIQNVGLPLPTGVVGGLGYNGDNQGFLPTVITARNAALTRLALGAMYQQPIPPTGDAAVPDPVWSVPSPIGYLNDLGTPANGTLQMITDCLTNCDDNSTNPLKRQPLYSVTQQISGIHQVGQTPGDPAIVNIPVVGSCILAATTNSFASLALGFGTYDFVINAQPVKPIESIKAVGGKSGNLAGAATYDHANLWASGGNRNHNYDYMVTASYVIRPFEDFSIPFLDDLTKIYEFAALGDERALPVAPPLVENISLLLNRPMVPDGGGSETVKLRWAKPLSGQSYALLSSYGDGSVRVLNTPYAFQYNAYMPFNTSVPANVSTNQDPDDADHFIKVLSDEPIPFRGSELHKYFVAGIDVFSRWSSFTTSLHTANSIAPLIPALVSAKLTPPADPVAGQAIMQCTLEIEIAWDWQDRSPDTIELSGGFFQADLIPSGIAPAYFSLGTSDVTSPTIKLTFADRGSNDPWDVAVTSSLGVISIEDLSPHDSQMVKYRLMLNNITVAFPAGAPYEVAYAIYARAIEKVRLNNPAVSSLGEWGPWISQPIVANMNDPRPPEVVYLPADIQYTAVPDVTKLGRGTLTWASASGATGYHVWEANETAVRTVLNETLEAQFPGQDNKQLIPLTSSLQDRANQLRDLLNQPQYDAVASRFFNKINKELITDTFVELELPGGSDVLFIYKISSLNSANIESVKSNAVFFAVPKVMKPAAPLLTIRKYADNVNKGFEVQVLNGNGIIPAGMKLFRTRKILMTDDVGMKGLPYMEPGNPSWQTFQTSLRADPTTALIGKKAIDIIAERSWKPYCYQAVAVGVADSSNGLLSGESAGSNTEIVYLPPDGPPQLSVLTPIAQNSISKVVALATDAPFVDFNNAYSVVEIFSTAMDASTQKFIKTQIGAWNVLDIKVAAADIALALNASVTMPDISRMATDGSGNTRFSILFMKNIATGLVRVTDPLGRFTEIQFS